MRRTPEITIPTPAEQARVIAPINPETTPEFIAGNASGEMGLSRTFLYHTARELDPNTIGRRSGMTHQAAVAAVVAGIPPDRWQGRPELLPINIPPDLAERIRAGQHVAVSMGARVAHDRGIGPTAPTYIEPSYVNVPATPLVAHPTGNDDLPPWQNIDGPTPNWVNNAADPNAVVSGIRGERVRVPEFEISANPTVPLTAIRSRRFDLIDRHTTDHQDYSQAMPRMVGPRPAPPPRPEPPRPYCPTSWERILEGWLDGA